MLDYLPFLILLMILAAVMGEHTILSVFYLLAGVYIAGRWWNRQVISHLVLNRQFSHRVFLNQNVPVKVDITNRSRLPVVWLQAHESLPIELTSPAFFHQVLSLGGLGKTRLEYTLHAHKRGYYALGPLFLHTGDLLGLMRSEERQASPDYLTVYPKIVPITEARLPSQSPFGTLRHIDPIFEDPSRVRGKRDYQAGDTLRRVDWKASAVAGRMLVKLYEPSIALATSLFLNLNPDDYDLRNRFNDTELAIVVAASLAAWVIGKKQSAGLVSNGLDPKSGGYPLPLPPRKGSSHLMAILDVLACIQMSHARPFAPLVRRSLNDLPWGTTLLLVTGRYDEVLMEALFQARRMGLNAIILLTGFYTAAQSARQHTRRFGFPLYVIRTEDDLAALRG